MTEPGYSEHHTGFSRRRSLIDNGMILIQKPYWFFFFYHRFGETDGGKWLQAHAGNTAFIASLPNPEAKAGHYSDRL